MSIKVFYCYAREDKALRTMLEKHLANLQRQMLITSWSDRDINAGKEWAKEIGTNLNTADIILLLISPDFMHSEYCYSVEMKRALEREKNGTVRVVPVILRHIEYEGAPFSHLQALPSGAIPVTDRKWNNRDAAFLDVAQGIRKIVNELLSKQRLDEGDIYYYRQQYEDALTAFERAINYDPNNVLAYIGQGQALNQLASQEDIFGADKYKKAAIAFTRAISLNHTNVSAYIGKGKALLGIAACTSHFGPNDKDKEEMLAAFAQAIRLEPNNEEAYIARGDAFMFFNRSEEAIPAYEKALDVTFPNPYVYKRMAEALFHLGRYQEALSAYERCMREYLNDPDFYVKMGEVLFNLGRNQDAIAAYEKALSLGDKSGEIYTLKGYALCQLSRWQDALDVFDQALRLLSSSSKIERAKAHRGKKSALKSLAQLEDERANELDPPEEFPGYEELPEQEGYLELEEEFP